MTDTPLTERFAANAAEAAALATEQATAVSAVIDGKPAKATIEALVALYVPGNGSAMNVALDNVRVCLDNLQLQARAVLEPQTTAPFAPYAPFHPPA